MRIGKNIRLLALAGCVVAILAAGYGRDLGDLGKYIRDSILRSINTVTRDASDIPPRPPFDQAKAAALVGKYVLVGVTYLDQQDKFIEQKQVHGRIMSAHEKQGFAVELEGKRKGEIFWLPPDLRPFQEAKPGEYKLRSTGEVVVDPDLLATWTVKQPSGWQD